MADEQLELAFPNPDDFPSYDEVDSEIGENELPADSYDENAATEDEDNDPGCCAGSVS
jgi:hypothetical protein